jgi:AICAR transformylase/IMP cyclohydrolase PurH
VKRCEAGIKFDDLIDRIDIGGPSLVRARRRTSRRLIVVSPNDYATR